jgi:hypothetical protein
MKKYRANLHINSNTDKVKFIGTVEANTKKELKENARSKARSWAEYGRIHIQENNYGLEFYVNA